MRTKSEHVDEDHNHLWLIDERFSFHTFLASDKQLKSVEELDSSSRLRPDIMFYDTAWAFGEGRSSSVGSLFLIEFKKPMRDDYNLLSHPVVQVMTQVEALRKGRINTDDGRPISLTHDSVPAYAFVLCDITSSFKEGAARLQMTKTHGEGGYILFDKSLNIYIEVISYDKLLEDAEKRNRILFRKLGIET